MGFDASLTASSAIGSAITYTPDSKTGYTMELFTAPKEGVYRFDVHASGGNAGSSIVHPGGKGGLTVGYLHMKEGDSVYVGAGKQQCRAAFVSAKQASQLADIPPEALYFAAGAGGEGGGCWNNDNNYYYACSNGGDGGGLSGGDVSKANGGKGGTQSAGGAGSSRGAYGKGGYGGYVNENDTSYQKGSGGDGYYGGGAGGYYLYADAQGGGGGSGYMHSESLTVGGKTYENITTQGGGVQPGETGYVTVTYFARAQLPVVFNGTQLGQIVFDGVTVESLIYNGTILFMHTMKRRVRIALGRLRALGFEWRRKLEVVA